jgi:hypothetical protein
VREVTEGKQFDLKADHAVKTLKIFIFIFNPLPGCFFTRNKNVKTCLSFSLPALGPMYLDFSKASC